MTYRPTPEIFRDVFNRVKENLGIDVYYDYGTVTEIVNRLTAKDRNATEKTQKYPLVWFLLNPYLEFDVDGSKASEEDLKDAHIIICTETSPNYSSKERYDNNVIPVLRPLYEEVIKELKDGNEFRSKNYKHTMLECLYWGNNDLYGRTGNVLNDSVDAIIIKNFDLLINENC